MLDKYIVELKPREPKIKSDSFDFGIEEITFNNSLEILNILNIDKSVSLSPLWEAIVKQENTWMSLSRKTAWIQRVQVSSGA